MRAVLLSVIAMGMAAGVAAQDPIPTFSSGVQLVEVYASVTDASGNPVTGLRQGDFEVFEDGERQDVAAFAAGEFPLSVALGIDRSWSMNGAPLGFARAAAQSF